MGSGDSGVQGQRAEQQGILHSTWAFGFPPLVSSTPVGAARSRPGRQVGDPYQAQKLLACSSQQDTTYSLFTITYYLRPRRWAMPGGLGQSCIGTNPEASLSAAQPYLLLRFPPYIVTGRVRELTYRNGVGSVTVCVTDAKKASPIGETFLFVLALPIFPASHPASIVGADELNFCVRDGNRWTLIAINTNYVGWVLPISFMSKPSLGSNCFLL